MDAQLKAAVDEIKTAFHAEYKNMEVLVEKQNDEIKSLGQARESTGSEIKAANDRLEQIAQDLKAVQEKAAEFEKQFARPEYGGGLEEQKSLGERYIQTDGFKNRAPGQKYVAPMQVGSFFEEKATLSTTNLGSTPTYLYSPQRMAGIIAAPDRMARVRDLMNVGTTTSGAIEYIRETGFTNAAATVAEMGTKPESALTFDHESATVKTIAHWLPVTEQMLADAPAIRSYIDQRLITGLKLVEDAQILYGDGTGSNLLGIMNQTGIQTYAWSDGAVGDNKVDAVRRAMNLARVAEYPVDGVVMHPNDWTDIELLKGSDGHYIWTTVTEGGQPRLWRTRVVDTTAVTAGDFIVGAFGLAAQLWDRQQASVEVSNSHADFFVKNQVAIRAEERLALTVYRPQAFVSGSFDSAPVETP